MTDLQELDLPLTYEETLSKVSNDIAKMTEFIVPVTKFEEQIIQVISDINQSGYVLFLYGISGMGKSTFVSSLEWRTHIPIRKIVNINASELSDPERPEVKLRRLYAKINQIVREDKQNSSPKSVDKLCIIIDYLESLQEEQLPHVSALFRDLNGLLRTAPVLIVWPVTQREDLEKMQQYASNFSSTLFHKRIPFMEFTGPPISEYAKIAKNTISFFNYGRTYHDFHLHDSDFESIREEFENKPPSSHIIRDYLKEIKLRWEDKTNYIEKIANTVPKPTEIWFIVCYPGAEEVVSRFAKQTFDDVVDETWNADYSQLSVYTKNNQISADWTPQRLSLALNGVFDTKIMYIPTNTIINCFAAYAEDAGIPISRQEFEEWGLAKHWLQKHPAKQSLSTTPLYLKLAGKTPKKGKRKGGAGPGALDKAKPIFERLNKDYISGSSGSDRPFNKALCLALSDLFEGDSNLSFKAEQNHPWLQYIRPDILIDVPQKKCICIEMHYTTKTAPNVLAKYILSKLNVYMKQVEKLYDSGQLPLLEITKSVQ